MSEEPNITKSMKLKVLLLSQDGGKTWLCVRQYYLTDLQTGDFLSGSTQGQIFKTMEKEHESKQPDGAIP